MHTITYQGLRIKGGGLICLQIIINIHLVLVVLLFALPEFKTLKHAP